MANDRLRDALLTKGLTPADAAVKIGVDPKTVERWITQSRVPYGKHRHALAALVQESERYLWPDALTGRQPMGSAAQRSSRFTRTGASCRRISGTTYSAPRLPMLTYLSTSCMF